MQHIGCLPRLNFIEEEGFPHLELDELVRHIYCTFSLTTVAEFACLQKTDGRQWTSASNTCVWKRKTEAIKVLSQKNAVGCNCVKTGSSSEGSGERTMTSLVAYDDSDQEEDDGALPPLAISPMDDISQSQGNQKSLGSNFYGPLLPSPHYKQLEIGLCDGGDGRTVFKPHREIYPPALGRSGIVENSSNAKPYSTPQYHDCVNLTTVKRHQAAPPGVRPYIPKRQRLATPGNGEEPTSLETNDKSTVSRLLTEVSERVRPYLGPRPGRAAVPRRMQLSLQAHQAPINMIQWCPVPQLSHLLLSASMDKTVKIWDGAESGQCLQVYSSHSGAVRDACWSPCGRRLLTGSFDNTAMVTDVETGQQIVKVGNQFKVMCLAVQPNDPEVFLCGGYSAEVKAWDARTCKVERVYRAGIQQTLAILFLTGGREFVTSSDSVSRDSAERTLIAWDFQTTAKVSNQIYHERYTCPSLALHPQQDSFVAQTNGNYMALFSAQRPYRMNKRRRYEGHKECQCLSQSSLSIRSIPKGQRFCTR
ncbi:WD repeat-containing protein 25 isoform X2 [Coregonus clupeaformis]|uniref:WD repeat-containing protein 25 isoform X2 n=1 Tax=Coregonus clupeaformis TaxID=59861 RepID=UPI001E1C6202|nr:WD repeat-containing protein 25 isoform X2 [Coregonus clupeaformis]